MSDSDSDGYSDYLQSRRAVVQKKRGQTKVYDSDSEDDFKTVKSPVHKKKRRVKIVEEEEEESFVDASTHSQDLKGKITQMEEEYMRQLYSKEEYMVTTAKPGGTYDSCLTNSLKLCDVIGGEEKEDDVVDASDADTSICSTQIPVTFKILDCEMRKTNEYSVPLEGKFLDVRKQLAAEWKCDVEAVGLSLNREPFDKDATPKSLGLRPLQIPLPVIEAFKMDVVPREVFTVESTPEGITLKVQIQNRKKPLHVTVSESTTILQIKEQVAQKVKAEDGEVLQIDTMKVMFDDDYVADGDTCESLGLEDADCLDFYL